MVKNLKKEEKVKVKLNKQFYNKEIIEETLKDFKRVCTGKILNGVMEVELKPKENIPKLKEEFCNYVLGLMKNKTLV